MIRDGTGVVAGEVELFTYTQEAGSVDALMGRIAFLCKRARVMESSAGSNPVSKRRYSGPQRIES